METKRLCLFLCAVFLILNIMFVCMVYIEKNKQEYLNDDYIYLVCENLKSNGISIDKKVIADKIPDSSVYSISTQKAQEKVISLSEKLAKIRFPKLEVTSTCFETPDGFSVGIYDENKGFELSKAVYTQNTFGIQYFDKDFQLDIEKVKEYVIENKNLSLDVSTEKNIENFVSVISGDDSFGYEITGSEIDDGVIYVGVTQTLSKKPIKDMELKLVVSNGNIVCAVGNWISTDLGKQYKETLIDGASVLYHIPDNSISQILSEQIVYSVRQSADFMFYLMPVWKIEYKDVQMNKQTVFVDAVSE